MVSEHPTVSQLKVTLFSFGFKHGHPESDLVWDVRFLPNPYWEPSLKNYTGLEKNVAAYVLQNETGKEFLKLLEPLLHFLLTQYQIADKDGITIAIGCTGGRHRSVAVTEHINNFLTSNTHFQLNTFHRDIEKE